jgi:hypothetical protein
VRYSASHPDEAALHHALRDALNRGLKNQNFFVWISVQPTGQSRQFDDLANIVARTDAWLGTLNPDAVKEKELPKLRFQQRAATVEITALPRKPEVRGYRADQIVGNPSPPLAGWSG